MTRDSSLINPFARLEQLLGKAAVDRLKRSRVAVFGLGAVGSFVVEALARSGIGYLRLVDFDRVDASNINRQIYALHSTQGLEKAVVARARVLDINPDCEVDLRTSFVNADSLSQFLSPDLDMVVDAIDGLNAKVSLILEAKQMGLNLISSMGAAGRTDVSMIRTGDLFDTEVCPLARMVRRRLRRRGLSSGVPCVYSIEPPLNKEPFEDKDAVDPLEQDHVDGGHGRPRPPIGSATWVPGCFGLTIAGLAAKTLTSE
ncbi:tRNA threonylcarbamoyladenosine dehydratase [Desulfobacter hydrogenophilus]|uniref:tRNA threonylcarbamoyladenosine dehydratase n=1 Tax=Desulfobacter hydrogenophilus TaxID=2291 RepID=A0A328FC31_9BACT|nr:tRNA threonylcarbamoyladenosine dehydratase [Desulfobacter hydrogenophilus]NDY73569.1 tRNA threonylcarbamoyladenosine dehydratase [Desulfobacter hydrogenophilus]QBH13664.1 tRNA threonylcarbamoyladenosine dehydratase [Desulfobacter hydrogenophilus]RAM01849.1 tRNA threonylcarbamoyladenosine dehydratase [Desulfobacter hydrogenophilus]